MAERQKRIVRIFTLIATTVIAVPTVQAQQAPRTLPAPDATYAEPFSSVSVGTVRELRDGRVIVADARDKVLQAIDFRSGSATVIGREGSGPAEFGLPMRVFGAPGDTTLLFDPMNSRYLVVGPDAKPVTTFRMEADARPTPADTRARQVPGTGGPTTIIAGGMLFARASDGQGRLYAETPGFSMGPNGPQSSDSAALVRFDRAARRLDTLAFVKLPPQNTQISGGPNNTRMMVGQANPLTPRDEWSVFPDGRLAVVRAADYHVDFYAPNGSRVAAAPIRYTPIRVTDADKREEEALRLRNRANQMTMSVNAGSAGVQRSAQMGPGANAPPPAPLTDWPDTKPPFRQGMASVLARPNGELWVRRMEAAGAKGTLYDILNANGAVTHQVRIPEGWTLVGFGNGTVYTTKLDEDDLVYLQRHRL